MDDTDGLEGFLSDLAWTGRWALWGLVVATMVAAGVAGFVVGWVWGSMP